MVQLFKNNEIENTRQSSKGNQLKWRENNIWYKADYTGYEGLAEYIISNLLKHSDLPDNEFVMYGTEEIRYENVTYLGCKSENFLPDGWQLITLERLFKNTYGQSLNSGIYSIRELDGRIRYLTEQVERVTGLKDFGVYLSKLLTIDAFFLNEDRHTHNIAVLIDDRDKYHYCPVFDNGAGLLADTSMDYPMDVDIYELISRVKSKTFCQDFDEQLDAVEMLYGQNLHFSFNNKDVERLLKEEPYYNDAIKKRVFNVLSNQIRKYRYLFK